MPEFESGVLVRQPLAAKRATLAIQRFWRRAVPAKTHRDLAKMYETLGSMATPVSTGKEYEQYLIKGRVLVEANVIRVKSRTPINAENFDTDVRADEPYDIADRPNGHFAFCYFPNKHELVHTDTYKVANREFRARYPVQIRDRRGLVEQLAYIRKNSRFIDDTDSHKVINKMIQAGMIWVLHEKYSKNFDQAIEDESNYFKDQPFSYGLHYNCLTFAQGTLDRLQALAPEPPSVWQRFRSQFW